MSVSIPPPGDNEWREQDETEWKDGTWSEDQVDAGMVTTPTATSATTIPSVDSSKPSPVSTIAPSEVRHVSATGGAKGRKQQMYSLIPVRPLDELAKCYGYGYTKYQEEDGTLNFLKGYPYSWTLDALQRHIEAFRRGEDFDKESGLHHLAHASWHLFCLQEFQYRGVGKDDRPYREDK